MLFWQVTPAQGSDGIKIKVTDSLQTERMIQPRAFAKALTLKHQFANQPRPFMQTL